jgi:hypothetical protein
MPGLLGPGLAVGRVVGQCRARERRGGRGEQQQREQPGHDGQLDPVGTATKRVPVGPQKYGTALHVSCAPYVGPGSPGVKPSRLNQTESIHSSCLYPRAFAACRDEVWL